MVSIATGGGEFSQAAAAGRTSAVAGQLQRDVQARAAACGDLFAAAPFDAAMFGTLSLAIAFGSPDLDSSQLRMAARSTIWTLGLDWSVDVLAKTPQDVESVVRRCRAVGAGRRPGAGDCLADFLADIRDELATSETYGVLRPVWRDELHRLLRAHERDWRWRSTAGRPDLDGYLENADSIAFAFVFVCHLISTGAHPRPRDLVALRTAGRAVQRVIRLLNDLASYRRDRSWGDLNALLLPGVTLPIVRRRIRTETADAVGLIEAVRVKFPELATYLERQMGFCTGFYGVGDFWGTR